jgi:hypothetical protein
MLDVVSSSSGLKQPLFRVERGSLSGSITSDAVVQVDQVVHGENWTGETNDTARLLVQGHVMPVDGSAEGWKSLRIHDVDGTDNLTLHLERYGDGMVALHICNFAGDKNGLASISVPLGHFDKLHQAALHPGLFGYLSNIHTVEIHSLPGEQATIKVSGQTGAGFESDHLRLDGSSFNLEAGLIAMAPAPPAARGTHLENVARTFNTMLAAARGGDVKAFQSCFADDGALKGVAHNLTTARGFMRDVVSADLHLGNMQGFGLDAAGYDLVSPRAQTGAGEQPVAHFSLTEKGWQIDKLPGVRGVHKFEAGHESIERTLETLHDAARTFDVPAFQQTLSPTGKLAGLRDDDEAAGKLLARLHDDVYLSDDIAARAEGSIGCSERSETLHFVSSDFGQIEIERTRGGWKIADLS